MNSRQTKTLVLVFDEPAQHLQIKWASVSSLIKALGGTVEQGHGSRAKIRIGDRTAYIHTPHPHKELKAYQVRAIRELLESQEIKP